ELLALLKIAGGIDLHPRHQPGGLGAAGSDLRVARPVPRRTRLIASFQVLRHRMADMQMAALKAEALIERAVLAEAAECWPRAVSAAAVETIDAVRTVGEGAVQLHGGMGLTEELALGGQFKRALAIAASLGAKSEHLARHAALV
ncbi:MAG: acyl-CoA dehydrogenase family protein, partial [Novosphingobium sp.]